MIRFFVLRILVPLFAILIVRSVVVAIAKMFSRTFTAPAEPQPKQARGFEAGGELKKDPVCGTYVSAAAGVSKRIKGDLVHFCSPECRDKYLGDVSV
jgi:YHS domain-containing protein